MRVGVLALQGAFAEHLQKLRQIGVEAFEIRSLQDIEAPFDALVLPGGESTVMGKLLYETALFAPLQNKIREGFPVLGTCAGLILLAEKIDNQEQCYFSTMHIRCRRNAYGRQLGSFSTTGNFADLGEIEMVFIRAPLIETAYDGAIPLAFVDGRCVAARDGRQLVTAFHPELTQDVTVYRYFLKMIEGEL